MFSLCLDNIKVAFTWNAMITGLIEHGCFDATDIFDSLPNVDQLHRLVKHTTFRICGVWAK